MNTIVVYYSKHGHTKKYAQWIAQALNCQSLPLEEANQADLSQYEQIVFGAPLYAGHFKGKEFLQSQHDKQLFVFTVGLSDPLDTDYSQAIDASLTPETKDIAKFYHLRAGMDYPSFSLIEKFLMFMMKKFTFEKIPLEKRDQYFEEMLANYYSGFDFSDIHAIDPLVGDVKASILV